MQGSRGQELSQLAVRRCSDPRRRAAARGLESTHRVQPPVMNSSITSPAQAEPVSDKVSRSLFWAIAVLWVVGIFVSAITLPRQYGSSTSTCCDLRLIYKY